MEGEDKEDLKALRRGWFLGGEEFLERLEGVGVRKGSVRAFKQNGD